MENANTNTEKDEGKKEDSFQFLAEDVQSMKDHTLSNGLVRKIRPEHVLILSVRKSQCIKSCMRESFLQSILGSNNRIPKQIMNFDEKYLRRCLELVYVNALKAASCNIQTKLGDLYDNQTSGKLNRSAFDYTRFVVDGPLAAVTENVVVSATEDWILGAITGSKSMMSILRSPLFRQLGSVVSDANFGRTSVTDIGEPKCSDYVSSPSGFSVSSSWKLQKDMVVLGDHNNGSEHMHKRIVSVSNTNSSCSDQSSSSASTAVYQGMLQCTWKDGFPYHVFSLDDQREVYAANLFTDESAGDKDLDYTYMFHTRTGGKKEHEIHENESDLVGKMKVSTWFSLCPNKSKIMETQFVLYGSDDNFTGEMQTSSHTLRKNKGLSKKKVVDVFRRTSKLRTTCKLRRSSAVLDNSSWEPCQDSFNNPEPPGRVNLADNHLPPNLELAAIVVKDHIHDKCEEAEAGGWGLKFLSKVGIRQTNACIGASVPSECCLRNNSDCSTSMDVIVPAGFHGGPRTRNGGPSSLIERWSSGGHCDCSGWDIGCPLTILNTRLSTNEDPSLADIYGECKTFDLFVQGSKQNTPIMKMVNIHEGLYYIYFQSDLSALQSFSIAAAIIHTHSPTMRPKVCRS